MNVPFVKLREVVVGKTGTKNPSVAPDVEFTYVDVAGVDNVAKRISEPRVLLGANAPSRARKLIRSGDVIVSTIRPNLNAVAQVPDSLDGQIASTGFCVLRPTDKVLPAYLFYFVCSSSFVASLCGLVVGALYPAVTDNQVLDQVIPIPPIAEQQRIVDFLSRAESIVRLRREAQQKAAELVPAIYVTMFGDPTSNPKGWPVKTLIELTKFQSGGTPPKSREDLWMGTLPWVSPKDMKVVEISDSIDHVSDAVLRETNLKLVPVGSLLIVVRGMILVHTVPVAQTSVPVVINQDMKALIPSSAVDSSYLLWALKVQHARILALVDTAAHGTKKLDTSKIEALEIPVPPIEMQRLFKRRAVDVVSIVCQQAAATVKAKATFDALLSRAFSSGR